MTMEMANGLIYLEIILSMKFLPGVIIQNMRKQKKSPLFDFDYGR